MAASGLASRDEEESAATKPVEMRQTATNGTHSTNEEENGNQDSEEDMLERMMQAANISQSAATGSDMVSLPLLHHSGCCV